MHVLLLQQQNITAHARSTIATTKYNSLMQVQLLQQQNITATCTFYY